MTRRLLPLVVAAGLLAACSDDPAGSAPTTSAAPVSTAAPTTTLPDTEDVLLAALPTTADMPDGWSLTAGDPNTLLSAGGGVLAGACNGGNQDWRATENNVEHAVNGADYGTPEGAVGYVTIFAFPTVADAQGYLALTRQQADCTLDFAVSEGPDSGEYNGFGDESLIGVVSWNVHEVVGTQPREAAGADESLVMTVDQTFSTSYEGVDYSAVESSVNVVERYGRFVLTANLDAYCCTTGYAEGSGEYRALLADLEPAVDLFREHAVAVLRDSELL